MIKQTIEVDNDIIEAVIENAQKFPSLMDTAINRSLSRYKSRLLTQLHQEPGEPHYPLKWTSERQRKYVMAKLRKMGTIPYQRSGDFVNAWHVDLNTQEGNGIFDVYNDAKNEKGVYIEQYVTGIDQQGFHHDTGWYKSQDILADAMVEVEDIIIETFFTVVEPII